MTPLLIVGAVLVLIALGAGGFGKGWGKAIGDAWSGRKGGPFSIERQHAEVAQPISSRSPW